MTKSVLSGPELVLIPLEELCFICGHTCDAFPLLNQEDIIRKYRVEVTFRQTFDGVRVKVTVLLDRLGDDLRENKGVGENNLTGHRVICSVGFIPFEIVTAHYKMDVSKVTGLLVGTTMGPFGEVSGLIVERFSIPETMPHYTIEYYHDNNRKLSVKTLRPDENVRVGQAEDLFQLLGKLDMENRPQCLKEKAATKPPLFSDVTARIEVVAEALKRKEEEQARQTGANDAAAKSGGLASDTVAPAVGVVASSSRLSLIRQRVVPQAPQPTLPKAQRKAGAKSRAKAKAAPGSGIPSSVTTPVRKSPQGERGITPDAGSIVSLHGLGAI